MNSVMYTSKSIPQFTVMKKLPPQKSRNKYGLRGRGNIGVGEKKKVIMGLYEIICVKLLKIVKHCRI